MSDFEKLPELGDNFSFFGPPKKQFQKVTTPLSLLPACMQNFIQNCPRVYTVAKKEVATYRQSMSIYNEFLVAHNLNVLNPPPEIYILFTRWLQERAASQGHSSDYIRQGNRPIRHARQLNEWLVSQGKLKETHWKGWARLGLLRDKRVRDRLVLTPSQIFLLRKRCKLPLRGALWFETLIATGMRVNEARQVRMRYVDFNPHSFPYDIELRRPSPYIGSTVMLHRNLIGSKTDYAHRRVYLSIMATRLLRRYMIAERIQPDEDCLLFPSNHTIPDGWQAAIQESLVSINAELATQQGAGNPILEAMSPIADDSIRQKKVEQRLKLQRITKEIHSKDMERRIKRRNERQQLRYRKGVVDFLWHCTRYTFTNFMFFRTYMGDRHNIDSVRALLGHARIDTSISYHTMLEAISTDDQWKQLWVGNPMTDWVMSR